MDIKINLESIKDLEDNNLKIDLIKFQKMRLLFNALEDGWSIKKRNDTYVFTKNHEGKREVLHESYLSKFMMTNLDLNRTLA